MKLFRVDADYENAAGEVVGMLSYFSLTPSFDGRSDILRGWNRDFYEVDSSDLTREQAGQLVGRPWPVLPLLELFMLVHADGPVENDYLGIADERVELALGHQSSTPAIADAKRQLDAALNHRGQSSARVAWERE